MFIGIDGETPDSTINDAELPEIGCIDNDGSRVTDAPFAGELSVLNGIMDVSSNRDGNIAEFEFDIKVDDMLVIKLTSDVISEFIFFAKDGVTVDWVNDHDKPS